MPEIEQQPIPSAARLEPDPWAHSYEDESRADDDDLHGHGWEPRHLTPQHRRRILLAIALLVLVALAAVLPPLVNMNRYQRRIVTSISASLGRPVHLDSVTLNLLPLPGFTLTNFVVSEDPSFGFEPVIRADKVTATLRMRSLWHHRVEFSKIALDDPSVNLVHRADGRWNIESILLQASHMPAIPTEEQHVPGLQRFPYIEATGGRVNLKDGFEKRPISLTDANFALWLAQPEMWRLRLEAHPTRTDAAAADTGVIRVEGTLGKAETVAEVPIDLRAEWSAAPLGAVSTVLTGEDGDVRGDMTLRVNALGTVGVNTTSAQLQLRRLRRADFVPDRTLDVDATCKAKVTAAFHHLEGLRCVWPPDAAQNGLGDLIVTGDVPDLRRLSLAQLEARWTNVPLAGVIDLARELSPRLPPALDATGTLSGRATCCSSAPALGTSAAFALGHARLTMAGKPLHQPEAPSDPEISGEFSNDAMHLEPFGLDLGGPQPAMLTIEADATGTHLHLTGPLLRSRLMVLGRAVPQFGDGLLDLFPETGKPVTPEIPMRVDLTATRAWGGIQTWSPAAPVKHTKRR